MEAVGNDSATVRSDAEAVGNDSAMVGNDSEVVGSDSEAVGSDSAMVGSDSEVGDVGWVKHRGTQQSLSKRWVSLCFTQPTNPCHWEQSFYGWDRFACIALSVIA